MQETWWLLIMHRREGPKFPWGKVLGWMIPVALVIVVPIACSNAVDEGEHRSRAMSTVIVTSAPSTTDCNRDFVGLDSSVEDAIARGYEINYAVIEESASPEEFISKRPDALREVAQVWRNVATNRGAEPARLLGVIADTWAQGAAIDINDAAAQVRNSRSLADAYSNLADKFEDCESTKGFASVLRDEALTLRQLANEAN